jgi:hypothetical protein
VPPCRPPRHPLSSGPASHPPAPVPAPRGLPFPCAAQVFLPRHLSRLQARLPNASPDTGTARPLLRNPSESASSSVRPPLAGPGTCQARPPLQEPPRPAPCLAGPCPARDLRPSGRVAPSVRRSDSSKNSSFPAAFCRLPPPLTWPSGARLPNLGDTTYKNKYKL